MIWCSEAPDGADRSNGSRPESVKTAATHHRVRYAGLLAALAAAGAAPDPQAAAAEPAPAAVADPAPPAAGALLREGSFILRTKGSLHRDADSGWWMFRTAPGDPHEQIGDLTLLPCALLENLEALAESAAQPQTLFDLTGQVFVYHGRNYLLPTHAPRLVAYTPPPPPLPAEPAAAPPSADAPGGESARTILRELEETVGPVLRSSRADQPSGPVTDSSRPALMPPGTIILWRRGWLVREAGGAWSFVFEADASGLADPPMVVLPCLLLEEMERHVGRDDPEQAPLLGGRAEQDRARRAGSDQALLVSGRVERYHARNYLLPTAFQVPRHQTPLRP
jgi:hypothetical protein